MRVVANKKRTLNQIHDSPFFLKKGMTSSFDENKTSFFSLQHKLAGTQPDVKSDPGLKLENNPSDAPTRMNCPIANKSTDTDFNIGIHFKKNSAVLDDIGKIFISNVATNWHAMGGQDIVRVDGYASMEGTPDLNWNLSCDRALAVANELKNPSDGIPGIPENFIDHFANGETDVFSATELDLNRQALISVQFQTSPAIIQPAEEESGPDFPDSFENEDCSDFDWDNRVKPADQLAKKWTSNAISKIINTDLYINMDRTQRYTVPQFECVQQSGGCAPYRTAGIWDPGDWRRVNNDCKGKTGYDGPDIIPSDQECAQGFPTTFGQTPTFSDLLEKYFKSPTPNLVTIVEVFKSVLAAFLSGDYTLECEYDCDDTLGYVYLVWTDIHICLDSGVTNECIANTLIHEFSHEYGGTDDYEYCSSGPSCILGTCSDDLSQNDAVENADSYSCFAQELYQRG